ncbi:hypothetical protein CERSUDRAFT_97235 [Gelatoporia subvermispora B]|uniref:Uncharacterized protein n=1 Tax=Ceriporiopsis subvermispora (strain B) TaxID=914234 RepID=M2QCA1_CERS8|nr:hypothetical protein CERSUDRAFT_97235 [Gelatoporia subvermispora B]
MRGRGSGSTGEHSRRARAPSSFLPSLPAVRAWAGVGGARLATHSVRAVAGGDDDDDDDDEGSGSDTAGRGDGLARAAWRCEGRVRRTPHSAPRFLVPIDRQPNLPSQPPRHPGPRTPPAHSRRRTTACHAEQTGDDVVSSSPTSALDVGSPGTLPASASAGLIVRRPHRPPLCAPPDPAQSPPVLSFFAPRPPRAPNPRPPSWPPADAARAQKNTRAPAYRPRFVPAKHSRPARLASSPLPPARPTRARVPRRGPPQLALSPSRVSVPPAHSNTHIPSTDSAHHTPPPPPPPPPPYIPSPYPAPRILHTQAQAAGLGPGQSALSTHVPHSASSFSPARFPASSGFRAPLSWARASLGLLTPTPGPALCCSLL